MKFPSNDQSKICDFTYIYSKERESSMRRNFDIFSEIRLRCAPGCKPWLLKFEWIPNWRDGQIESLFCSQQRMNRQWSQNFVAPMVWKNLISKWYNSSYCMMKRHLRIWVIALWKTYRWPCKCQSKHIILLTKILMQGLNRNRSMISLDPTTMK